MQRTENGIFRRRFLTGMGAVGLAASLCSPLVAKTKTATIFAHGGGQFDARIAKEIKRLAGRRVLISPYSGADPAGMGASDTRFLKNMGLRQISVLDIQSTAALSKIAAADMIWFSGGSQKNQVLRLAAVPGISSALHQAFRAGTVMAGGSAGAAVMSKLMISGGRNGAAYTRAGLGFWPEVVLDQHVAQRGREYRLRKVISANRALIGVGLDEATAVTYRGGRFKVSGRGKVRIVTWKDGTLHEQLLRRGQSYDTAARARV